jgi:hypothetical protein
MDVPVCEFSIESNTPRGSFQEIYIKNVNDTKTFGAGVHRSTQTPLYSLVATHGVITRSSTWINVSSKARILLTKSSRDAGKLSVTIITEPSGIFLTYP